MRISGENAIAGVKPLQAAAPTAKPDAASRGAELAGISRALSQNLERPQMMPDSEDWNRSVISAIEGQRVVLGCDPHES